MKFRMDQLLSNLATGLDEVEKTFLGAPTNHGKRLAILNTKMGKYMGWSDEELIGLASCAQLHDNALTEYILSEQPGPKKNWNMKTHCIIGEKNASSIPFPTDTQGFILYHHEHADGSGAFAAKLSEIPLGAQFIAITDMVDVEENLGMQNKDSVEAIKSRVMEKWGTLYTPAAVEAFQAVLNAELLEQLRNENVATTYKEVMPHWTLDLPATKAMPIANFIGKIIDYKSNFTAKHTDQIANRAYVMAKYYGMDEETCAKVFFAASLHDIGKLMIPSEILEKNGKLDDREFEIIKSHVHWSYVLLENIEGFDEVCRWATTHHRKINGTGYPELPERYFPLDFVSRLMTCIDIYQAVREARPYHPSRTHEATMSIMQDMVNKGEIDEKITKDMDIAMAVFKDDDGYVPGPLQMQLLN
jgi:HD-GYP domain-containing protein (c-di-GMP phosphodiesterase class II)